MPVSFNQMKLGELFRDFYTLTGLRMVIFDDEFREIFSYPEEFCSFCRLIKNNPYGRLKCAHSDKNAFQRCRETGKPYTYQCHAGLFEAAVPIIQSGIILGYVMFGQIIDNKDKEIFWTQVKERCSVYELNEMSLKKAFFELLVVDSEKIKSAAKILEACASYILLSELITLENEKIVDGFYHFVKMNLNRPFTVSEICDALHVSRTKLYDAVKKYTNLGVSEYVTKERINLSKKLLVTTDKPVSGISSDVGIEDYNYFSKYFKKWAGVSPLKYRKSAKKEYSKADSEEKDK